MEMKRLFSPFVIPILLVAIGCKGTNGKTNQTDERGNGKLLFSSGFEPTCRIVPLIRTGVKITQKYKVDHIVGVDKCLPDHANWDTDVTKYVNGSVFMLEYTSGTPKQREAKIVEDPMDKNNHVLLFNVKDYWLASEGEMKARVQAGFYNIKPGLKDFYQSVRVYIDPAFKLLEDYPAPIEWLTISEFWNNEWWVKTEKYGFRITLGIGKDSNSHQKLHFICNAEDARRKEVWKAINTKVSVPIGKWFTMEYYMKEGNMKDGRFWKAITEDNGNRQVVYDVRDWTYNSCDPNPNGITGYNPMKLSTSKELVSYMKAHGKSLRIFWDDLRLWKDKIPQTESLVSRNSSN